MAGSIHHAEDMYELAGEVFDQSEWEARHRRLHGLHVDPCLCFEKDTERRWPCESWLCRFCSPKHHNAFIGCAACRVPWPCEPWIEARRVADTRRRPPTLVFPEGEESEDAA